MALMTDILSGLRNPRAVNTGFARKFYYFYVNLLLTFHFGNLTVQPQVKEKNFFVECAILLLLP